MEQGLLAIGIGIMIFGMGIWYGTRMYMRYNQNSIKTAMRIGSVNTYAVLLKAGIIDIKYNSNNPDDFELIGINKSISFKEFDNIIESTFPDDMENKNGWLWNRK